VNTKLSHLASVTPPSATVSLKLAPVQCRDLDDCPTPLHLRLDDIRRVTALNAVDGEGTTLPILELATRINRIETLPSDSNLADVCAEVHESIHRLQSSHMTDEERALPKLTRRALQKLSNWDEWDKAFDKQLEQHFQDGTIGHPVAWPTPVDGRKPNVQPNLLKCIQGNEDEHAKR
jgi:hypothetical protein